MEEHLINFKEAGFDEDTSDFLNWCMKHRDNLEFIKLKKTLELRSASAELHFTDVGVLAEIGRHEKDRR
jgi:hypothetical protein